MRRANFIAPSHASVPEFVKKTFDGNASATRRSASAARRLVVVEVARVDERLRLLLDRGDDLPVAVAEAVHRDAGGEVEPLAAVRVPEPGRPCPSRGRGRGRRRAAVRSSSSSSSHSPAGGPAVMVLSSGDAVATIRVPGNPPRRRALPGDHDLGDAGRRGGEGDAHLERHPAGDRAVVDARLHLRRRERLRGAVADAARRRRRRDRRASCAPTARAMPSAASSAFTLTLSPSAPFATGDTTGRKPPFHSARIGATSTRSGTPTRPRFGSSRARTRPPSRPDRPTAGTPAAVRPAASALLTRPDRTISTTSIASGEVSRRPSTKRDSIFERLQQAVDARGRRRGRARRSRRPGAPPRPEAPTRPGSSSAGPPTL